MELAAAQSGEVCSNFTATLTTWRTWPVPIYPASSAALGGACPALSAVPKISRNLVAYLACLIVNTPYVGRTADTSAGGLGEAHAEILLKVLKLATDEAYNARH